MERPRTQIDTVHKALEPYGFLNGKYGELPYKLEYSGLRHKGEGGHYRVIVDGRTIAEVGLYYDGTYNIRMQLATWLRQPKTDTMWARATRQAEADKAPDYSAFIRRLYDGDVDLK